MSTTKVRISDVLELERRPVEVEFDCEYKEIGVRSFGRGIFHKNPVAGSELGNKRVFYIHPGDLVFSNVFAWEGAVALAGEQETGRIGSHRFMTYSVNEKIADSRYLSYFFCSERGLAVVRRASPGSAGRNRTLGIKNFAAQEIELPDLDEQRRIATKLDALHSKAQRSLDLIKRSSELRTQLLDAALREAERSVPMETFLSKSEDLVDVIPEDRYETAGLYSYGRGLFRRPTIYGSETKYVRYNRLHHGDFVYSKLFAWEGSVTVVPQEFDGVCVSQEFPTFNIDVSVVDPTYVLHLTRWPELRKRLSAGTTGMGSRRQRVNVNQLLATEVPLPSLPVQRAIAKKLSRLACAGTSHAKQEQHLKALRSSLLNAAFTGQL